MALRANDISQSGCNAQTAECVAAPIAARGTRAAIARDRNTSPPLNDTGTDHSLFLEPRDVLLLKTTPRDGASLRLSVNNPPSGSSFENTVSGLFGARGIRVHSALTPTDSRTRLRDLFTDPALDGGVFPKRLLDELVDDVALDTKLRDNTLACMRIVLPLSVRLPSPEPGVTRDDPSPQMANSSSGRAIRSALSFGDVVWRRSEDEETIVVSIERRSASFPKAASRDVVWPPPGGENESFRRIPLSTPCPPMSPDVGLIVSKAEALPTSWTIPSSTVVLVPGTTTWRKLAQRGVWVHGSFDGLGEEEHASLARAFPEVTRWVKLGHTEAIRTDGAEILATYRLESRAHAPNVSTYTHFFWKSGSQFEHYLQSNPDMRAGYHGSGPGHTHATIARHLGANGRVGIFLGLDDFMEHVL